MKPSKKRRTLIFVMILTLLVPAIVVNASSFRSGDPAPEAVQTVKAAVSTPSRDSGLQESVKIAVPLKTPCPLPAQETASSDTAADEAAGKVSAETSAELEESSSSAIESNTEETSSVPDPANGKDCPVIENAENSQVQDSGSLGEEKDCPTDQSNANANFNACWKALCDGLKQYMAVCRQPEKPSCSQPEEPVASEEPVSSEESVSSEAPEESSAPSDDESSSQIEEVPESEVSQVTPPPADQSFEDQVAALVNEQRAANGLSPLTLNQDLSAAARAKSQDMHDNHYFSHTSPTYGSPFDMLTSFGISYRAAGENIAMGYSTPEAVMDGWMNSPGHRANILNASYTQIGVGYVADGSYWTQEFIG